MEKSSGRDGSNGGESRGDVGELGSIVRDSSRKSDSGFLDEVSNNSKHSNTSVLDLNESETIEVGFIAIGDKSEGIVESKRRLGTELVLEGLHGGGGSGLLGGGESSGGGDKGKGDDRLHGFDFFRLGIV